MTRGIRGTGKTGTRRRTGGYGESTRQREEQNSEEECHILIRLVGKGWSTL